jgi:hypothetical protein
MAETTRQSPYQGLIPYEEDDAPFFFGREKETRLIIANLFAAPLTLLYGGSGVGKTSVLHAGAVHKLRQRDDLLVVPFNTWQSEPVGRLKAAVAKAAAGIIGEDILSYESVSLAEFLVACVSKLDRQLMIILDQFEEYFLYSPWDDGWVDEFPKVLTCADLPASFLISIREDSLAKLDLFEGRIPGLFDNYLRIEHLDREAARAAVEKPIEQYNRLKIAGEHNVGIEPKLVKAVLEQLRTGQIDLGRTGRGGSEAGAHINIAETRIETPYLQLVMSRLWNEEMHAGSHVLRLETLNRLEGAKSIVRTHLDGVMKDLSSSEQKIAASIFHYLVTPSGTKIAHTIEDLAKYAELEPERIAPLIDKLSGAGSRIVRSVAPSLGRATALRYEIFHDVLAASILDWRERYLHAEQLGVLSILKRHAQRLVALLAALFCFMLFLVEYQLYLADKHGKEKYTFKWIIISSEDPFLVYYLIGVSAAVLLFWVVLKFTEKDMQIRVAKWSFIVIGFLVTIAVIWRGFDVLAYIFSKSPAPLGLYERSSYLPYIGLFAFGISLTVWFIYVYTQGLSKRANRAPLYNYFIKFFIYLITCRLVWEIIDFIARVKIPRP